ncbi:MAG: Nitrilase [Campylobacterota bacterium]|nr:Nitrilase [Campylobacterota bacterium]
MRVTLAQTSPKLNRTNLEKIVSIVNELRGKSDLIVFAELSLNGYMLQDKLYEDAWVLNELDVLKDASIGMDIVVGAAVKEDNIFRNSALYFSNGKLLSQHYKVHLPNYGMFEEARYFKSGSVFESFDSSFGKVCMLVCEDLWHTSVYEELEKQNPDIIIALAASPARGFKSKVLEIEEQWYEIIKNVAKRCRAKLFFVNRVGFEDGLGFWGGSCIVADDGTIVHQLPRYKETIETFNIQE